VKDVTLEEEGKGNKNVDFVDVTEGKRGKRVEN